MGDILTKSDHLDLYDEIKECLFTKVRTSLEMTDAQRFFTLAFESACFEDNFLYNYAQMVEDFPEITVRNLHAFCLGHGLGRTLGAQIDVESETNH